MKTQLPSLQTLELGLLERLCRLASIALNASSTAVYRDGCDGHWQLLSATKGHPGTASHPGNTDDIEQLQAIVGGAEHVVISDLLQDESLSDHAWSSAPWKLRFLASLPLTTEGDSEPAGHLVITDTEPRPNPGIDTHFIGELKATITETLQMHQRADASDVEDTEYQRLVEELERSNRQLEEFAYVASHDLQEPLRMVTGFLGLLEEDYGHRLDEEAREYIEFAVDGSRRMKKMINDLLAYSRLKSSNEPFIDIDTDAIFVNSRDEILNNHPDVEATITHQPLPVVWGRREQLHRLFSNLLVNALKHSGPNPQVEVWSEERSDDYLFAVVDHGVGIDKSQQERIFDIFVRGGQRPRHDSTGIGLAICTAIVEEHGGRLWVDSTPGEGATFYFTISKQVSP